MIPQSQSQTTQRLLLVGLGRIAKYHLAALETVPNLYAVAAVDPGPTTHHLYRGTPIPLYSELTVAIAKTHPDIIVIATPTGSHVALAEAATSLAPDATVLVEKPWAAPNEPALRVPDNAHILYHMRFASEVLWATAQVSELGALTRSSQFFFDPYAADQSQAVSSLHSSWYDSGINALSALSAFAAPKEVSSLRILPDAFSTFAAELILTRRDNTPVPATLLTSWEAGAAAQSTTLTFDSGHQLVMNHTAGVAYLLRAGLLLDFFAANPLVHRRQSHYQNLYQVLAHTGPAGIDLVDTPTLQHLLDVPTTSL